MKSRLPIVALVALLGAAAARPSHAADPGLAELQKTLDAVDREPRHRLLRRALLRAERKLFASGKVPALQRERFVVLDLRVVALKPRQPPNRAGWHGELKSVEIGDVRCGVANRLERRPGAMGIS